MKQVQLSFGRLFLKSGLRVEVDYGHGQTIAFKIVVYRIRYYDKQNALFTNFINKTVYFLHNLAPVKLHLYMLRQELLK